MRGPRPKYEPKTVQSIQHMRGFLIVTFTDDTKGWLVPGRETVGAEKALQRSLELQEQILVRSMGSSLFEGVAFAISSAIVEV